MKFTIFILGFLSWVVLADAEFLHIRGDKTKGAVCLDGSPPAYNFRQGFGSGANNWLIYLQGGGWCKSIKECLNRTKEERGSSQHLNRTPGAEGILSSAKQGNKDFYNWNTVHLYYCDGASFTGDSQNKVLLRVPILLKKKQRTRRKKERPKKKEKTTKNK